VSDLFRKARARHLPRWAAAYLAAAWVTAEVMSYLSDLWSWPPLVGRVTFVFLATGLGVALVLAWYHGERGRQRVSLTESVLLVCLALGGALATASVVRAERETDVPAGVADAVGDLRSLVVLPFRDLSPDGGHEYLGDGIAETLINGLARLEGLRVVARTSAFQFKDLEMDVRQIAARLGAGAVVEGSVAQAGDRVRVTAMLVDARTGLDLWSNRFDREVATADLFGLQDEVAQEIVDALRVELAGTERIVARGTRDPDAQRAYYLGVHHWTRRTTHDIVLATDYFHEAIAADSLYAEAWAGLALTYVLHRPSEYNVPGLSEDEALDRAEAAALRAIELDGTLGEPHAALGEVRRARRDWEGAYREFRLAVDKNPGYATAHHWLADLLMEGLRGEEALEEIDLAVSLDPVAPAILVERAEALMMLGRTEQATEQMALAIQLIPDSPLVRQFEFVFAVTLDEWERAARAMAAWSELSGADRDVALQIASPLRESGPRERFLEGIAAGEFPDPRLGELAATESLLSPTVRFLAVRKVRGDEAALDYLETALSDPALYLPLLPAVMGPELFKRQRTRELMASLYPPKTP